MSSKDNEKPENKGQDPDLNDGDISNLENFDEPFPKRRSSIPPRRPANSSSAAGRVSGDIEIGLGSFFKGLNEVANFINDLAEKTEQAAQRAADKRRAASGDFQPQTNEAENEKGFVFRWGINSNFMQGGNNNTATPFTNRPANNPFSRPANPNAAKTPASNPNSGLNSDTPDAATVREPYMEIHDEAEEGLIIVIAELPGVEEQGLQIEIQDDVLSIRGEGPGYRYEKETLLPAAVAPQPQSQTYHNGLLELRLKRIGD